MRCLLYTPVLLACFAAAGRSPAGPALPLAEDVKPAILLANGRDVWQALQGLQNPLSPETRAAVKAVLLPEPKDPDAQAAKLQELLDPYCLIAVTINPESRVKAARGPAAADLSLGHETAVLIKVYNEAGVTHALGVTGPEVAVPGAAGGTAWLEAAVHKGRPSGKGLSGNRVEYVILRLKPHQPGRREATLRFDVGQGTQDLGFRAEVPVLFRVRPAKR